MNILCWLLVHWNYVNQPKSSFSKIHSSLLHGSCLMWIIWDNPSFASGSILADMAPSTHATRWSTNRWLSLSTSWSKKSSQLAEVDERNVHYLVQYSSILIIGLEKIGARVTSKVHEVQIQDPRPKPNLNVICWFKFSWMYPSHAGMKALLA